MGTHTVHVKGEIVPNIFLLGKNSVNTTEHGQWMWLQTVFLLYCMYCKTLFLIQFKHSGF